MSREPSRSINLVVDGVEATAYTIPADASEADGTLAWDSTTLVVVTVRAGGLTGLGWTYGPTAVTSIVRELLAPVVIGRAALDVPGAWEAMLRRVRNATRIGVVGYAISAVDVALWDLKARLLELPLHRLLGTVRDTVPVYGSGGFTSYDDRQLREQLEGWAALRIPRMKIKIGESWGTQPDRDLTRVAQARRVVGDDVELFVDANGAYERKQAIRIGSRLAESAVTWFEEPVSSDDLEGLAQVRSAVSADVTAGEYGGTLTYFRRMCEAGAVDCLQADASRCGGITEWLRVAAVAAAQHLEISGHCAPHLHVHVAAAAPNLRHLEWFHDHVRIEGMAFDGTLDPTDGVLRPSDAPGHGLRLRGEDLAPFRVT